MRIREGSFRRIAFSVLNEKVIVVNGTQSEARYLTTAEKAMANQILDDINDYVNLGDSNAYQRLLNNGIHTLNVQHCR